eukprot:gene42300-51658_t
MSTAEAAPASDRKRSTNRRRRPSGGRGRGERKPAAEGSSKPAAEAAPKEPREPRAPRPPSVPVPEALHNKKATGVITAVIRKRGVYGFIAIGGEGETSPSIYFNTTGLVDSKLFVRRGLEVEFTVAKDEEGRFVAQSVQLTAAGEKTKAEQDAAYEARKAERAAAAAAAPAAA